MVLIVGNRYDLCSCKTYEYLAARRIDARFIDEADLFAGIELCWSVADPVDSGFLRIEDELLPFNSMDGILVRIGRPVESNLRQEDQLYATVERNAAMIGWLNEFSCPVVNRPAPTRVIQPIFASDETLLHVARNGFKILKTLVTSTVETAVEFYEDTGKRALLGTLTDFTPAAPVAGDEGFDQIKAAMKHQPIYLQEYLDGAWIRVFVAGDKAFGSTLRSDGEIASTGAESLVSTEIPASLAERCCQLTRDVDLRFAHIDALRGEKNIDYCINLSPYPMIDWCETDLQERITAALANLLRPCEAEVLR